MDKLYTLKDAMDYLKVSRTTLYRIMKQQGLMPIKVGGSIRFTEKELQRFIDALRK
jgi:excisionase family DNA binding protein